MTIIDMVKVAANLHIPYKRKDTYFSNLKKHAISNKFLLEPPLKSKKRVLQ